MEKHVRNWVVDWSEDRLSAARKKRVDQHLEKCSECRAYFEKMSGVLLKVDHSAISPLTPDPFLPTRIKAIAEARQKKNASNNGFVWQRLGKLQAATSAVMVTVAISIGIFLGKGLASQNDPGNSQSVQTSIASEYYDAFSNNGLSYVWEAMQENQGEENQ